MELLRGRLQVVGRATFTDLAADCRVTLEVVARFLALLELYREKALSGRRPFTSPTIEPCATFVSQ